MMPAGAYTVTFARNFIRTAAFAFTTTLALAGCRGDDPLGTASATETGTGTDATTTTSTSGVPTTTGVPTTSDGVSSTTGDDTSTGDLPTTTNMSAGFITTATTTTGPSQPQPNGGMCEDDADCQSMNCYTNPIFDSGICSECNEDSDCVEAGTGISCSIQGQSGAVCTEGALGDQCMSQEACQDGLMCDAVIDLPIPGVIPNTCGECGESADCDGDQICSPVADLMALSGSKQCVEPGSIENGALCPRGEDHADAACASGQCADVSVMGFLTLGMCGECKTDADCDGGQTCISGMLGMGGASGSTCQ